MEIKILIFCILLLILLMAFMYYDFRKRFSDDLNEMDLQKLKRGLSDEQSFKPIVDIDDAIKYNNERRGQ